MPSERFSRPIEASNIEEHEELLSDTIAEMQLEYIERIFLKKIPSLDTDTALDNNFSLLLQERTSVVSILVECFKMQQEHIGINWTEDSTTGAIQMFKDKIIAFYEADPTKWIQKTITLIKEEREKTKKIPRKEAEEDNNLDFQQGRVGMINFDVNRGDGGVFENTDASIGKNDVCLSIHMEPLFKTKANNPHEDTFSVNPFEQLAVAIVEKYPETKAIVASSWIMDLPIAKRMGFTIYKEKKYDNNFSFWGQFLDSKGQFKTEEIKKFFETGKAPHTIATGAIMVEDFLKKYLPKEKRGKLLLKESNPFFDESQYKHDQQIFRQLFEHWDRSTTQDIEDAFAECPLVQEFLHQSGGTEFKELLLELKKEKKARVEVTTDPRTVVVIESFKTFIRTKQFNKKEVIIE